MDADTFSLVQTNDEVAQLRQCLVALKQENAQLRERASRDQVFFTHGPLVFFTWVCAEGWPVAYASPNVFQFLGHSDEDFTSGRVPYSSVVHPDDLTRVAAEVQAYSEAGVQTFEQEYRLIHANGETRWIYDFTTVLRDEQGAITHYYGYLLDTTNLKQAEESLRGQTRFFETVINTLPVNVFVKDAEHGRFVMWNKTAENMLGLTAEQVLGKTDADFFPPEQAAFFMQKDRETLARGTPDDIPSEPIDSVNLGRRFLHTIKVPVYDSSNNPLYLVGISEDITERLRREEELRIFRALADNSPDAIGIADPTGAVTYANLPFRTMFGYGDATIGMINTTLFTAEDQRERIPALLGAVVSEGAWTGTLTGERRDGSTFPVQLSPFAIRDGDGQLLAIPCILRDLSDVERAAAERAALQEQIIASQQAAIHELSTPLLPLGNKVLALPLIGSIDSTRAQQIIETLLKGVANHHAAIAIIDITGVQVVDTQVANAIIHAAQAVKLLGAQVVLTGIRPEVAQTLISLGTNLDSIIVRGTLRDGIAYALR